MPDSPYMHTPSPGHAPCWMPRPLLPPVLVTLVCGTRSKGTSWSRVATGTPNCTSRTPTAIPRSSSDTGWCSTRKGRPLSPRKGPSKEPSWRTSNWTTFPLTSRWVSVRLYSRRPGEFKWDFSVDVQVSLSETFQSTSRSVWVRLFSRRPGESEWNVLVDV